MKNSLKTFVAVLLIATVSVGTAVYAYHQQNRGEWDLMLADVEVIARAELPEIEITCSSGSSGQCFQLHYTIEGEDICHAGCHFTGYQKDYCSGFLVGFVGLCSLLGIF